MLDSMLNAVIADFGFVTPLPTTVGSTSLVTAAGALTLAWSRGYLAPEITDGKHGVASDVYSYGVVGRCEGNLHDIISICHNRWFWRHSPVYLRIRKIVRMRNW